MSTSDLSLFEPVGRGPRDEYGDHVMVETRQPMICGCSAGNHRLWLKIDSWRPVGCERHTSAGIAIRVGAWLHDKTASTTMRPVLFALDASEDDVFAILMQEWQNSRDHSEAIGRGEYGPNVRLTHGLPNYHQARANAEVGARLVAAAVIAGRDKR